MLYECIEFNGEEVYECYQCTVDVSLYGYGVEMLYVFVVMCRESFLCGCGMEFVLIQCEDEKVIHGAFYMVKVY